MRSEPGSKPVDPAALVLSGGGKWGSFGAGMLANWKDLPRFSRVTGVSTGALLGTFAFLGEDPAPDDRILRPEDDFPAVPDKRRNVDDAVAGYTISREATVLKNNGGEFGVIRKGSFGDLAPLRDRLYRLITPKTILALANEYRNGRHFYVALLNIDSGKAEAVDMTELAAPALRDVEKIPDIRACYIETLMAAGSEPVGAQPVFIDNTLYVDAGVRFGVFLEEIEKSIRDFNTRRSAAPATGGPRPAVYMIVNGQMSVSAQGDEKWSPLTLAKRSMELVTDQIYRFSAKRVADYAKSTQTDFYFAYAGTWAEHEWQRQKCVQWRDTDARELKPLQFYPNMMKCLIDYGSWRARTKPWDEAPNP
ncbi:MAG: patatin-like phospholipase family protein [Sphingobium sp.]|nr:patatin-like phospholipase family protein [Sphingobium sp.]MBP9158747.1 patatin-like phospholipase family protein [Sphingobium sp.]